jgi:Tol biopolymer transport system component
LNSDTLALAPDLSGDGKTLLYSTLVKGKGALVKMDLANRAATTLLSSNAWKGVFSPDGSQIACNYYDAASGGWKVLVFPAMGGPATGLFELPGTAERLIRWTPDGSGLGFIVTRGGVSNLWRQPLKGGGAPTSLTTFTKQRIFAFAWSPDGQQLALSRGKLNNDAVLISEW